MTCLYQQIHQQILEYQINTFGLNNIEAAKTSETIGKLLVMTSNFEDAEIYVTQSIQIYSNLLLLILIKEPFPPNIGPSAKKPNPAMLISRSNSNLL